MRTIYNRIFTALLLTASLLTATSCRDDDLLREADEREEMPVYDDAYAINFVVTTDNMGTRSTYNPGDDPEEITKWENYINLERFRVLFFDDKDMFLFESKNRWVKQVDAGNNFSSWYVSVPLGAYGNDTYGEGQEYDWDYIRNYLTSKPFKIAILANRPAQLLYPGFIDSELSLENGVFDNDGPYWGPEHTGKRSLFELQHYQYDIIYDDKGEHNTKTLSSYYDFIMGDINTTRPTMGSAINWVSFDNGDTDKELLSGSNYMRNIKMPSAEHPIPMYGVQEFDPIPAELWKKGSPFDISNVPDDVFPNITYNYNTVSLLRCCVRLDLKIPKSVKNGAQPKFVTLWYSNIYSRTEPMDNWTPTDQIWNQNNASHSDSNCEMSRLISYGPLVTKTDPGNGSTKAKYQERLKWFYGAWLDKGWKFQTINNTYVTPTKTNGLEYPRIMNSCIQRNKVIRINNGDVTNLYADRNQYWHYVVYTGERNPNDVNSLPNMPSNPYIACFVISWDMKSFYCIPLLDYAKKTETYVETVFGPSTDGTWANASPSSAYNTYINDKVTTATGSNVPYPLLRNHIYKFTLKGTKGDEDNMFVTSEVNATPDINFSEQVKRAPIRGAFKNATVKTPNSTIK